MFRSKGSSQDIPSWTNLVNLEWVAPGFVDEANSVDWSDPSVVQTGEESNFSEMAINADDGLVVTVCAHRQMIEDDTPRNVTMIQTYRFQTQGASFQLFGYAQEPLSQNEFVSCEL